LRITSHDLAAELLSKLKAAINTSEHEISSVIAFSTFTLDRIFAHTIKHVNIKQSISEVFLFK
ncbi:MAG: hypothetical protein J5503_06705, partial [Muribaculaceae bacterium]|nr:hypothetical protein [Muribaculaceae bacterium]